MRYWLLVKQMVWVVFHGGKMKKRWSLEVNKKERDQEVKKEIKRSGKRSRKKEARIQEIKRSQINQQEIT